MGEEQQCEEQHFRGVVHSFLHYEAATLALLSRAQRDFAGLSERHHALVPTEWFARMQRARACVAANRSFIEHMVGARRLFHNNAALVCWAPSRW